MNAILIHANNLSPFSLINFRRQGSDRLFTKIQAGILILIDFYMRNFQTLLNHEYKVIFISYTLSQQNYLN